MFLKSHHILTIYVLILLIIAFLVGDTWIRQLIIGVLVFSFAIYPKVFKKLILKERMLQQEKMKKLLREHDDYYEKRELPARRAHITLNERFNRGVYIKYLLNSEFIGTTHERFNLILTLLSIRHVDDPLLEFNLIDINLYLENKKKYSSHIRNLTKSKVIFVNKIVFKTLGVDKILELNHSEELFFESEVFKFIKKIDFKIDKIKNNHIKMIYNKIKEKNIYSRKK